MHTRAQVKVAAFTVWNGNLWGLRRSLLPWMQYHTQLGVCKFYVGRGLGARGEGCKHQPKLSQTKPN